MVFIGIIVAIVMFSIIILVHEWWHFAAARKFGVTVEEFGLGIPPRAKKLFTDKKGTLFSLNWLPIGWFVKLKWENPELLTNKQDPHALWNKPAWQQSIIILGWVFMNFMLASIIFAGLFMTWVKPIWINDKISTHAHIKIIPTYEQAIQQWILIKNPWIILYPTKDSIASQAGILEGDIVIALTLPTGTLSQREKEIKTAEEFISIISENAHKQVVLKIKRGDIIINTPVVPLPLGEARWGQDGKIWSYISENITFNTDFEYKYWFFQSLYYWISETYNQSILTFQAIGSLLKRLIFPETPVERSEAVQQVSGPIGIVDFISGSIGWWVKFIMIIAAIISINLWVFNLLPIPALDGGRFIFITINGTIEKIFWKKLISAIWENIIHMWFFVLLIILSILIAYNDITKIIGN